MAATRKWSLLAAIVVVALVVSAWVLLIAPKRSEASALRADAVAQDAANDRLTQKLAILKAQQADLPRQRARVAALAKNIPDNPALPTLVRNLTAAGRKAGTDIQSLTPAPPVALVAPAAAVVAAPPATTDEATDDAAAGDTEAPAAPVAAPAPPAPSLYEVPLAIEVTGSYFELEQFVNNLERLKRSFQVVGFTLEVAGADEAPAGDLKLTLQSRVFLSPAEAAATATATSTPVASAPVEQ